MLRTRGDPGGELDTQTPHLMFLRLRKPFPVNNVQIINGALAVP